MTTTSRPSGPGEAAGETGDPAAPSPGERTRIRGPLRRLLLTLIPADFALFAVYGAVPAVMLPIQVDAIDPARKVANLALVTTIGAFAAMVAQPVAGTISDRTRTRFGRRAPWIVLGALAGGLSLTGMALANGIAQIALAWAAAQIAYNFAQGPLTAILPDRVPARALGTFAAVAGMAAMVAAIGGQGIGAAFAHHVGAGYVLLAGLAIAMLTLFVILNPDKSSRGDQARPFRLDDFARTFWVNPVAHPDFFWAFTGRLLLYTGFFSVYGYDLYILQDYVGLGGSAVKYVAVLGAMSLIGMLPAIAVCGPLSDRTGRRKIFVFTSSVLVGAALLIPIGWATLAGMMVMSVLAGAGFGAFQSVDQALMTQVLPSSQTYAKDLGVVNIAATLPQAVAPAVGGAVVVLLGYPGLFTIGLVLSVLGSFAVFFIRSVR